MSHGTRGRGASCPRGMRRRSSECRNNLAPSITNLTTPSTTGTTGSLTIGNPKVHPFRATNYDFSVEWYFTPGSLLSGAYFIKKVTNYPQVVASAGTIQDLFTAEEFAQFLQTQPDAVTRAWLTSGGPYDAELTYNIGEHLTLTFEGLNLTAETDDRWVYQADPLVAQYSAPGRSYFAGFRFQY